MKLPFAVNKKPLPSTDRQTDRQATAQPVIPLAKHSPKFSTCQHPLRGFMESIITESLLGIYYPKACPNDTRNLPFFIPEVVRYIHEGNICLQ